MNDTGYTSVTNSEYQVVGVMQSDEDLNKKLLDESVHPCITSKAIADPQCVSK